MEPDRTHMGIQLQGSQPGWSEEEGPGARGAHVESRPRSGGEEGPGARGARVERGPGLVLARATAAPGPHFSLCSPSAVFLSKDTPQSQKALEMLQEPSPSGEPHTLRVLRSPAIEKHEKRGFPGGSVVTNPHQCGFHPRSGKMPHTSKQLSPRATAVSLCTRVQEAQLRKAALCSQRGRHREKLAHRNTEEPRLIATRESPSTATEKSIDQ